MNKSIGTAASFECWKIKISTYNICGSIGVKLNRNKDRIIWTSKIEWIIRTKCVIEFNIMTLYSKNCNIY